MFVAKCFMFLIVKSNRFIKNAIVIAICSGYYKMRLYKFSLSTACNKLIRGIKSCSPCELVLYH